MEPKNVLIVDDEPDMRIFISTLFKTSGYSAVAAKNGIEGIQKARDNAPDLIILDVMMPGEGGVTMYKELRTDSALKQVPVIMVSAIAKKTFTHYLKMLNARLNGAIPYPEAYMEKPPEAEELLQLAESFLQEETEETT